MTAPAKPATALPWPITVNPDGVIVGPWRGVPPLAVLSLAEKREVARRANALPRLEEENAELRRKYEAQTQNVAAQVEARGVAEDKLREENRRLREALNKAHERFLYICYQPKHPANNSNEAAAYNAAGEIDILLRELGEQTQ